MSVKYLTTGFVGFTLKRCKPKFVPVAKQFIFVARLVMREPAVVQKNVNISMPVVLKGLSVFLKTAVSRGLKKGLLPGTREPLVGEFVNQTREVLKRVKELVHKQNLLVTGHSVVKIINGEAIKSVITPFTFGCFAKSAKQPNANFAVV